MTKKNNKFGYILITLIWFLVLIVGVFAGLQSLSDRPSPRGQYYLSYDAPDVQEPYNIIILMDWEGGAACWIVDGVGVSCLPIDDLNRGGLLGMMYGHPVAVTPAPQNIPEPWRQNEVPSIPGQ